MDYNEIRQLAKEQADVVAPEPRLDPVAGAIFAFIASFFILRTFTSLAGIEGDDFALPILLTIGLATGGTYWFLRHQQNRHFKVLIEVERSLSQKNKSNKS